MILDCCLLFVVQYSVHIVGRFDHWRTAWSWLPAIDRKAINNCQISTFVHPCNTAGLPHACNTFLRVAARKKRRKRESERNQKGTEHFNHPSVYNNKHS